MNELILTGEKILPHIIVACANTTKAYDSVTISKAADSMLAMSEVEATLSLLVIKVGLSRFLHEVEAKSMYSVSWNSLMEEVISTRQPPQIEGQDLMSIRQQLIETIENEVTIEKENVE